MKLTRRGEIVIVLSVAMLVALALWGGYQVINNLWYVQGEGYCWGTLSECMYGGK
jgi:hypothetical protein